VCLGDPLPILLINHRVDIGTKTGGINCGEESPARQKDFSIEWRSIERDYLSDRLSVSGHCQGLSCLHSGHDFSPMISQISD